jgi:hypothetical protein
MYADAHQAVHSFFFQSIRLKNTLFPNEGRKLYQCYVLHIVTNIPTANLHESCSYEQKTLRVDVLHREKKMLWSRVIMREMTSNLGLSTFRKWEWAPSSDAA